MVDNAWRLCLHRFYSPLSPSNSSCAPITSQIHDTLFDYFILHIQLTEATYFVFVFRTGHFGLNNLWRNWSLEQFNSNSLSNCWLTAASHIVGEPCKVFPIHIRRPNFVTGNVAFKGHTVEISLVQLHCQV